VRRNSILKPISDSGEKSRGKERKRKEKKT